MLKQLYKYLTQNQANIYGLVLSSEGIPYLIKKDAKGWEVWVEESVCDHACDLIAKYIAENQYSPDSEIQKASEYHHSFIGAWISMLLIGCHFRSDMYGQFNQIVREYGASAAAILDGEIYRTVTALMLHSDYVHLAGNVAGIFIFGTAVSSIAGAGVGSLMILASGILGNYANAVLFEYGHTSIGASTAVFGAVGISAAYQFYTKIKMGKQRMQAWLPLAGGLALLGFLGTGKRADLTAHLFGFIAGIGLGLIYTLLRHHLQDKHIQIGSMATCVIILVSAWFG